MQTSALTKKEYKDKYILYGSFPMFGLQQISKHASGLKRGRDNTQTEKACRDQSNRKHDHNTKYVNKQLVNNDPTSTLIMKILNLEP